MINLIGWDENKTQMYLIYEYLPKYTLRNLIDDCNGALDIELVKIYASELVHTIALMKKLRIAHRDIKPENIYLDTNYHVNIDGFNVAVHDDTDKSKENALIECDEEEDFPSEFKPDELKEFDKETIYESVYTPKGLIGTPAYMSPEMVYTQRYSPQSDEWAVGAIVYECLAGKSLFKANEQKDVYTGNINFDLIGNPDAKEFVKQCLVINPSKRKTFSKYIAKEKDTRYDKEFASCYVNDPSNFTNDSSHKESPPVPGFIIPKLNRIIQEELDE
jgi:serine/threonine protein kinase